MEACASGEGFLSFPRALPASLAEAPPHLLLGAADGDDAHCLRVCSLVAGCNTVLRETSASANGTCSLFSDCFASSLPPPTTPSPPACTRPAAAMLRRRCHPSPTWRSLAGKEALRGSSSVGELHVLSAEECRVACARTPACNSVLFARALLKPTHRCSLHSRCVAPSDAEARASRPPAGPLVRRRLPAACPLPPRSPPPLAPRTFPPPPQQYTRLLRVAAVESVFYASPCTAEVASLAPGSTFPRASLRRLMPSTILSGLASIDCRLSAEETPRLAFEVVGTRDYLHLFTKRNARHAALCAPLRCISANATPPRLAPSPRRRRAADGGVICGGQVTEIEWPEWSARGWRQQQREWYGMDVACASVRCDTPPSVDRWRRLQPVGPSLFDSVAAAVASRSFNGREVVLLTSNVRGLPLAINLVANLAQLGISHSLILADGPRTCQSIRGGVHRPACVYSSLLRGHAGMRVYATDPVWALWLQRYLYFHRLLRLGYNALLLDSDIVLFHDPYRFFKGELAAYSLISLCDSSAGVASTNGGVWYAQNASLDGPVVALFAQFERHVITLLNDAAAKPPKVIRYTPSFRRGNQPADVMLYDQAVMNNIMFTAFVSPSSLERGRHLHYQTYTPLDVKEFPGVRRPAFWSVLRHYPPTPSGLGVYDFRFPDKYALRVRPLRRGAETLLQSPAWLFSAESDGNIPVVPTAPDGKLRSPGRASAALWGAHPAPVVLVHFVCAAWPGSGGRQAAMELWGKWYAADMWAQLRFGEPPASAALREEGARPAESHGDGGARGLGFDVRLWLHVCGLACVSAECTRRRVSGSSGDGRVLLQPCTRWLLDTEWNQPMAHDFLAMKGRRSLSSSEGETRRLLQQSVGVDLSSIASQQPPRNASPTALQPWASPLRTILLRVAGVPAALVRAASSASTSHPQAYIAFRYPIHAVDRREYQLHVHILHSAAALTGRLPVLPLAYCSSEGEWSARSRCIYVLHAERPAGAKFCVMRPPSPCHGKVALPHVLTGLRAEDVAIAHLPRLKVINGSVDVIRFAAALSASSEQRERKVLLLDQSGLRTADDISALLLTPKGWLCTLEHKSCQSTC
ncbi:hypothetical protein AB1Y20_008670 [Prymnesium parvum]|uniref:Nucleotide-diphospho-sugar transferase domain-containing protein n=1 Tax=Prymnesium parvum TaxID=97485 RepID=A0AB34ITQ3_PRYPA